MKKRSLRLAFTILVLTLWSVFSAAQTNPELEKATRYLANGQFDEVIAALEPWIDDNPDVAAYYILGYALYEKERHQEAIEMFEAGYLLDPAFSPSTIEGLPWIAEMEARVKSASRPSPPARPVATRAAEPNLVIPVQPAGSEMAASTEPEPLSAMPEPQVPEPVAEYAPPPEPPPVQVEDLQNMTPQQLEQFMNDPERVQAMMEQATQGLEQDMPMGMNPMQFIGILQTVGVFVQVLNVVGWIFFSLCLFLVARKVGVAGPWLAFIPIVQVYTVIRTAGKPWWWLLVPLLFIPASFLIVLGPIFMVVIFALMLAYGAAICMGIAENMGRNKWMGLILMIPLVSLIYWGVLAFSRTESSETYDDSYYQPHEEGNPDPMG